jgi:ABC-type transport system substrate-binding protein
MFGVQRTATALLLLAGSLAIVFVMACTSEPEVITKEVVVEKEVVKEVQVPGETVVVEKEVVKEVQVPGETVVVEKEVVKEVQVPGETVVVEKEVVKQVEVPGETVVIEKEVIKEVEVVKTETVQLIVTPTAMPVAMPGAIQAPQPKGEAGIITIAIEDVAPGVGLGSTQLTDAYHYWGIGEVTMKFVAPGVVAPMLASAWELKFNDAGKPYGATLTIRDDVIFHGQGLGDRSNNGGSWGPMTAEDIAFTVNDGNNAVNNASIHWQAGDFAAMFGSNEAVAVDSTTMDLTFNVDASGEPLYDPRWSANLMNDAAQAFSVQSLNRFNTVGKQEMQDTNFIGTGPLQIVEWVQDDTGILEAVPYDHWSANAKVDRIIFKEVGEQNTQIALMETGEVDAAPILLKNLPRMLEGGFRTQDTGLAALGSVVFSGNLWETNHVVTNEPLDTAAVYMRDLPWISNPDPSDSGRAPGISDADEGRLVRNALARAVDRDLINEVLLNGLGFPAHLNQFSPTNPNWQSKWEYPYDPAEAGRLLDQAGYAPNSSGKRFDIPLYAPNPGGLQEVADAIAGFWEEIGISTAVQKYAYSVYRPTIVARATTLPWVTGCDDGKSTWPWEWPKSQDHTSLTRGGFGCGLEIKKAADTWVAVANEPDVEKQIALNNELAQYLFDEAVSFGVVGVPFPITYNPNKIAEWPMDPSLFATWNNPEDIVPAGQ